MEKKTPSRSFMPHNGHKKIDFEVSICRDKVFKGTLTGY